METSWNISGTDLLRLVCEQLLSKGNGTIGEEETSCVKILGKGANNAPEIDNLFSTSYASKIVLTVLYAVTFLVAVIGNTLVVLTFVFNPRMRSTTNSFIVSLAMSDFLVAIICMPINLGTVHTTYWVFGAFGCKLVPYAMTVAVACSSLTLCCIALDRYKAIVHPLKLRSHVTSRHVVCLVVVVWVLAAFSAVPNAIFYGIERLDVNYSQSNFISPHHKAAVSHFLCAWLGTETQEETFLWFQLVFLFIAPFTVMVVFYGIIGYRLWIRKPIGARLIYLDNKNTRIKKKVIKMLVIVVSLFAVCWLPLLLFDILKCVTKSSQNLWTVRHYIQILAMSSTCYNPVVYTLMNENFKQKFANVLFCRRNRVDVIETQPVNNLPNVTRIKVKSLESTMTSRL